MAIITPNTTYPNGANLSVPNHNANVYATASGRGIMSEPNGGLQVANLDVAFTVRDEHIMPEEAVVARMDGSTIPMDIYNNAFGVREDADPSYVAIAGLGQRVYVPYDMAAVVWQWSFHVSLFRPFMTKYEDTQTDLSTAIVRCFLDGVELPVFRRSLPISADIVLKSSPDNDQIYDYEDVAQLWYDISKMQASVTKGYHELTIKVYLPRVTFDPTAAGDVRELEVTAPLSFFTPSGSSDDSVDCKAYTRVSFGTRSVRCVMFK